MAKNNKSGGALSTFLLLMLILIIAGIVVIGIGSNGFKQQPEEWFNYWGKGAPTQSEQDKDKDNENNDPDDNDTDKDNEQGTVEVVGRYIITDDTQVAGRLECRKISQENYGNYEIDPKVQFAYLLIPQQDLTSATEARSGWTTSDTSGKVSVTGDRVQAILTIEGELEEQTSVAFTVWRNTPKGQTILYEARIFLNYDESPRLSGKIAFKEVAESDGTLNSSEIPFEKYKDYGIDSSAQFAFLLSADYDLTIAYERYASWQASDSTGKVKLTAIEGDKTKTLLIITGALSEKVTVSFKVIRPGIVNFKSEVSIEYITR